MANNKSAAFENALLKLIFNNDDLAGIGDAAGLQNSAAAGSFYLALMKTGYNQETATMSGLEATTGEYAGYARVAVARTTGGWTVSGSVASNTATISFPACTGGTGFTATHAAICKGSTLNTADVIISGDLTTPLAISNGVTPQFAATTISFTEY